MKNTNKISFLLSAAIMLLIAMGCDTGPASISSLKVSKDKDGKETASSFKADEKIYVRADVSNNFDNTKIKYNMTAAEDVDGLKSGEVFPGTDAAKDFGSDYAYLTVEFSGNFSPGKYKVNVELQDKDGKKLDSKSSDITIEKSESSKDASTYSPPVIDYAPDQSSPVPDANDSDADEEERDEY